MATLPCTTSVCLSPSDDDDDDDDDRDEDVLCLANTRVVGQFAGLDELSSCGTHSVILSLIKESEEIRHQVSVIPSEGTSPDR